MSAARGVECPMRAINFFVLAPVVELVQSDMGAAPTE